MTPKIIYFSVVALSFLYALYKLKWKLFNVVIILLFYEGLFSVFLEENYDFGNLVRNGYRSIVFVLTLILLLKNLNNYTLRHIKLLLLSFGFLTFCLFVSFICIDNPLNNILNQYNKYFFVLEIFIILRAYFNKGFPVVEELYSIIIFLFGIQIFLSVIKLLLMGLGSESIVGSVSAGGASLASILPVLGFIIVLLRKNAGVFSKQELLFVCLLFLIGIASNKRAIWLLIPFFVLAIHFFVRRRKFNIRTPLIICVAAASIFYFGVRLNPTLNSDGKVWGSFDLKYAYDYINYYTFGQSSDLIVHSWSIGDNEGRGGSLNVMVADILDEPSSITIAFGHGIDAIFGDVPAKFFNAQYFGVVSRSALGGAQSQFIAFGYFGMLAIFLFGLSLLYYVKNIRMRFILIVFFSWEYFLYHNSILYHHVSAMLLIFIIFYSNQKIKAKGTIDQNAYSNGNMELVNTNDSSK